MPYSIAQRGRENWAPYTYGLSVTKISARAHAYRVYTLYWEFEWLWEKIELLIKFSRTYDTYRCHIRAYRLSQCTYMCWEKFPPQEQQAAAAVAHSLVRERTEKNEEKRLSAQFFLKYIKQKCEINSFYYNYNRHRTPPATRVVCKIASTKVYRF